LRKRQGCREPVRLPYDVPWYKNNKVHRRYPLDHNLELDKFLAAVEKRAFRVAELAIGNRDDALDILQETMYKLAEKYADRDPSEWTPLFYRILQNQVRDWYRREKFRNRFRVWFGSHDNPADSLENRAGSMNGAPEDDLHNRQVLDKLGCVIRQLPLRQQQAFMLRTFEELDVRQTAKIMGCSEGSVKTHYSRAVHRLRMLLGEDVDD